jgi:hypothetical protein
MQTRYKVKPTFVDRDAYESGYLLHGLNPVAATSTQKDQQLAPLQYVLFGVFQWEHFVFEVRADVRHRLPLQLLLSRQSLARKSVLAVPYLAAVTQGQAES